jgi:hypothetical protein
MRFGRRRGPLWATTPTRQLRRSTPARMASLERIAGMSPEEYVQRLADMSPGSTASKQKPPPCTGTGSAAKRLPPRRSLRGCGTSSAKAGGLEHDEQAGNNRAASRTPTGWPCAAFTCGDVVSEEGLHPNPNACWLVSSRWGTGHEGGRMGRPGGRPPGMWRCWR